MAISDVIPAEREAIRAYRRPQTLHTRYERIFEGVTPPFAFVDLGAMAHNAEGMLQRARSLPIRIATKSVRSRAVIERILGLDSRFRGLMTFTLPETLWLAEGGHTDLLLAYPTTDTEALRTLARLDVDESPVIMVDSAAHLDFITRACAGAVRPIRVCIDIDMGYWRMGGRLRIGPKRSPIRTAAQATALARHVVGRPGLELAGLMGYEGHVAGVGDKVPGRRLRGQALRKLQQRWMSDVAERRAEIVDAVRRVAPLDFVNGGGTGSLHLTSQESSVTEVTAGSGFYAPGLFDQYSAFTLQPAAMFILPVVRKPREDVATLLGGGYIASGSPRRDRLPLPHLPTGLRLDAMEGAGEVQTPVVGRSARSLHIGDRVYLRHAKAGELCERFNTLLLIDGEGIVDEVPTYRGEGQAFL